MKKVLVAYASRTGTTGKMADYIAEGVRFAGHAAEVKRIADIRDESALAGYDGYVFGCPTYHKDITQGMKTFLFLAEKARLLGKMGGAFGASTHSGESPQMIYDTMQFAFKMDMVPLGALSLRESVVNGPEGPRACQDYGKAVGQMFK